MCKERPFRKDALMVVGMAALVLANVASWWMRRHSGLPEDAVDGVSGFLMGIAIATLLLAVWRNARR